MKFFKTLQNSSNEEFNRDDSSCPITNCRALRVIRIIISQILKMLGIGGPHSLILPVPQYLAIPLKVPFPGVKKACHSTFVSTLWFITLTSIL